ncbi:MAG: general secretion pathway protein GspK [Alphaproteobacteria bacterium]|nr:general secretion pathway protein GspK [Alphaproteobacteria bacterium]
MTRQSQRRGERGAAVIVVLWGIALVATAILAIGFTSRSESLIGRNALENARARQAAEAGVQLGLHRVLAAPRGMRRFDGNPIAWRDDGAAVEIAIQDEEGKIDLNMASYDMIAGSLRRAGLIPEGARLLACRIVGRRGYLDPQCFDGTPAYAVERGLLVAVEELHRLPGLSDAAYARLTQIVTVFSGSAAIDPTVAPRDALLAIPTVSEGLADSYVGRRDTLTGGGTFGGSLGGLGELNDRRYFALSTTRTFSIRAQATTPSGGRAIAEMVVRLTERGDRPYAVLAWREPAG